MPAILLSNICTALGQVNGARGIAVGIVVDPTGMSFECKFFDAQLIIRLLAEFFEMDDLYILCTKPPACVLFRRENSKHSKFEDLEAKEFNGAYTENWLLTPENRKF